MSQLANTEEPGRQVMVTIREGVRVPMKVREGAMPQFGVVPLVLTGSGEIVAAFRGWNPTVKLGEGTPKALGLDMHYQTLKCLCDAGLIATIQMTPNTTQMDVASFFKHMTCVKKAAKEYWSKVPWKDERGEVQHRSRAEIYRETVADFHAGKGMGAGNKRTATVEEMEAAAGQDPGEDEVEEGPEQLELFPGM